jgi:hypothetical protein
VGEGWVGVGGVRALVKDVVGESGVGDDNFRGYRVGEDRGLSGESWEGRLAEVALINNEPRVSRFNPGFTAGWLTRILSFT